MQVIAPECIGFMMIYYFIKGLMSLRDNSKCWLTVCSVKTRKGMFHFQVHFLKIGLILSIATA